MKPIILIIGLLVVGCGKQEQADTNESTPTTNTNKADGTTAKPVKELTAEEKKVVGVYEVKREQGTFRASFLENGTVETILNGKVNMAPGKWKIEGNEVHVEFSDSTHFFYRVNPNFSLTQIAGIKSNEKIRRAYNQGWTYKKVQ